MKNFVFILLVFCCLSAFSQKSGSQQLAKNAGIEVVDILNYQTLTDISQNPGFTGALEKQSIRFQYSSQWLNMEKFPYEIMGSYDRTVGKNNRFGVGILFNRYQFSTKKIYTVDLSFSAKFRLNDNNSLRWGMAALSYNKNIQNTDRTGRVYGDMIHDFLGPWNPTFERKAEYNENYFNIKTGVWLTGKKYFGGLSILNITQLYFGNQNQVENSLSKNPDRLPLEIVMNGGYEFSLGSSVSATPALLIEARFNMPSSFSPSLNFSFDQKVILGFTYHNMNVAAINIGARLYEHLNIIFTAGTPIGDDLQRISKLGILETGVSYIF
jgi:type IX secretion system PorP/SprF family membrane protein